MKHITLLLTISLLVFSCGSENPSQIYREFQAGRKLEFISDNVDDPKVPVVSDGENLVFKYTYAHEEDENIADDELAEMFYLEIPKGSTSYTYNSTNTDENGSVNAAYRRSCFCGFSEYTLEKAIISASKINESEWHISFDVIFKGQHDQLYPLKDNGKYNINTDEYF